LIPVLPDKYQNEAQFLLDLMKEMRSLNEAIKNVPATARLKAWKSYKKTLEMKLKLKQKLIEG
jgi:regulator of protease activity HflC (stomatin/prohibitin superfamily)